MTSNRRKFRLLSFFIGSLFLCTAFSLPAFAKIEQWNFENKDQYLFDSKKIDVSDGSAHLVASIPLQDSGKEDFDKGTYDLNTFAPRGAVELTAPLLNETLGQESAMPVDVTEPQLVGLWHFDEPNGTNALDEASRTVAKTSNAEVVSSQIGFGFARSFDGDKSSIFIPHYQTFKFDKSFTLEAWIRPARTIHAKPQTLISRWQEIGAQKSFALQISPEGKLDFLVSPDGALVTHQTGETVLAAGVWYHVAAVYNKEDLRIYVNGVLDQEPLPYAQPIYISTNPLYIGSLIQNKQEQFYQGAMDELAFYGRALTQNEILTHSGNSRGLVGLWHLNERGGLLADSSGFGQNGNSVENPIYEVEGRLGKALEFNGTTQFIEIPSSRRFAASDTMTLEAWIKPSAIPGLGELETILASTPDKNSLGGNYALMLSGPEGTLKAWGPGINPSEVSGKTPLMPYVWHHVAATWGEGKAQLFVDGILETSQPYQGILTSGKSALRIARDAKDTSGFKGAVDEVAIYHRVRTPLEIARDAGMLPQGGIYTSAVKDSGSSARWRELMVKEALPYKKEISNDETGLLHHYSLNEDYQNLMADSKGQNDAVTSGTYPIEGKLSKARWFQAAGFDKIISQKNFPPLSTFTINLWFQFASSQPGLSDRLFSIGDSAPSAFRGEDGRIHVVLTGAREIVGQQILKDTAWHYLTLTADGRNLFLYIDGIPDGNSPFVGTTAEAPLVLGNLKSTDTFQGALDDFSFYNAPLDREAIFQHFLRPQLGITYQFRTANDPAFPGSPWRDAKGNPSLEIQPDAFSAGLWHFNEEKFPVTQIADASRFTNHGRVYGRPSFIPLGVAGPAISFNGSSDWIRIPDTQSLHLNEWTLSLWIRPHKIQEQAEAVLLDKTLAQGSPAFSSFALELISGNRLNLRLGHAQGYQQIQTEKAGEIAADKWNHIAASFDGKEVRIYINGSLKKLGFFRNPILYDEGPLYLGRYGAKSARFYEGDMDEVLITSQALKEDAIGKLYQNGVSENPAGSEIKLDLEQGRYFQYRTLLTTEYPKASPALQGIMMESSIFPSDRPSISNQVGFSFADLSHFSEKLGPGNRGQISYQLSRDGANWFFHNGRRWVIAANYSESNTVSQIESRISDFAKEVGIGSFYFKAFLHSPTGMEQVELDNVEVEYLPNKMTLLSPNGAEAWLVDSEQTVSWTSAGEVQKVNLEYSKDDFKSDFHSIVTNTSNTGNFTWKIPDDAATQVKVRAMDALDPRVYDASDLSFRIIGNLEVVSPNWNERWEVGSSHEVIWKTKGTIPNVRIDFSTDDFVKTIFPIIDSVKNEGKYVWKVTDPVSSNVKVRVSDVRDPLVFDKSNDVFTIHGKIKILSPTAESRWIVGSNQEIRWDNVGAIQTVRVEYQTSQSPEWKLVADEVTHQKLLKWKIPDEVDTKVKIRITDLGDSKVKAESPEFAIHGGIRLTNPTGGENWTVGSRRKIAWQTVGTVAAVNIEYRLTSKEEWIPIAKSVANTGSYLWDIPEAAADGFSVRVTDVKDEKTFADSVTPSRIVPSFILKSPNGNENLKIGSEFPIEWDFKGKSDEVKLEYSKDNFEKDIHTIIGKATNIGRFNWTVPDDASQNVKIRISDPALPSAHDLSDADFRIFGAFQFTAPTGGEKFEVGSLATLTWKTTGAISRVRIEYSNDDFVKNVHLAANDLENTGKYVWTVPDEIGTGYAFRITDLKDPKTQNFSDGLFSIIGQFRILEPKPGESYTAGTIVPIQWKGAGSVSFVRIDFSENSFLQSFQTIAEQAPNKGTYDWTVPNLIGHEFKIRIWDPAHPDAQDVMSGPANIIGGFRLLAPNGGEILYVGDEVLIKWEVLGTIPTVKLEYSNDHFTNNIGEIADAYENTGVYKWQIPDLVSGNYRIRVSDVRDAKANDISNSDFKVRSRFTLFAPNGGEGWSVGETQKITWQTTGSVSQVHLEYTLDDFASVKVIAQNIPNQGFYDWVIPDQVSQNVKVRVTDAKDLEAYDVSDGPFRIQGGFQFESPKAGELWKVGEQRTIQWKTTGQVSGVRLDYSRDNFASEIKTILESLPNSGTYHWTVPDDISEHTQIRILDLKDPQTKAASETFQIIPSFMVMSPNGGEHWFASEKREINWTTLGTVKEVNLEFSNNDFQTEPETIDRGVLNTGRFSWELPREVGDHFTVRICDAAHPAVCDVSDKPFSMESPFEWNAPNKVEVWQIGSNQELRWNVHGYVPRVTIQYAISDPPKEWKMLQEELPNQGHYLFKVPDDVSKNVRFRISDFEDADLFGVSTYPVHFVGTFQVLTPNGGEKWMATRTEKITWNTIGTIPNVRLEYSSDDFQHEAKLIESSYKNTGSYDWKVPGDLAPSIKIRVQDADNPASFDISDETFKILPHFTLSLPNGGEHWFAGEKASIEWKTEGSVPRVRLEYGVPQEEDMASYIWKPIAEIRGNLEHYDWQVPLEVSSRAKIRVYDERDPETADESDEPFKILGRFKLSAPHADEVLTIDQRTQIQWQTFGKIPSVKLEYAVLQENSEQVPEFKTIENFWTNTGSYFWTVPDDAGEKVILRISDAREPEAFAMSEAAFKIRGVLAFNFAEEKMQWPVGSRQTLRWNTVGSISNVKLEYSTDGKNWKRIEESTPNAGTYGWLIPDDLSQTVRLRVSNVQNPAVFSESQQPLSILGVLQATSPAAGERWTVASKQKIAWETLGGIQRVLLQFASENENWKPVAAAPISNSGNYEWVVPDAISSTVRVRLQDADNPSAFVISSPFSIVGDLGISSPVGGEVWNVGSNKTIQWKSTGTLPWVRLEGYWEENPDSVNAPATGMLYPANPWFVISEKAENKGRFEWTVPDKISNRFKIRVSDVRDPLIQSTSPKSFSIIGTLHVLTPKAGEVWTVGAQQQIVWASQGTIPAVVLEYSRDDFYRDVNVIASEVPNTGAALWTVPDSISKNLKIRISDSRDKRAVAYSDAFEIKGDLAFITPAADSVLKVGSKIVLHWKTSGTLPRLRLEYSRDNFQRDVQVFENALENQESYEWTVPDIISSTVKLRITDTQDAKVQAVAGPFKVEGSLALQFPQGGERFQALATQKILWKSVGSISKVRLEYSRDDFNQDIHALVNGLENKGFYEWTVPDDLGSGVKLRVLDESNFNVASTSEKSFTIHGAFGFSGISGGERWTVSSLHDLLWQTVGSIPQVKLEYSKDDFQTDLHVIAENVGNQNKFSWEVPDDISENIRFRVTDVRDPEVTAVSGGGILIVGQLEMTSPVLGAALRVGEEEKIQWNTVGSIPAVRLEYQGQPLESLEHSDNWKLVTGLTENQGEFVWKVPNDISHQVRIRVSDARDAKTFSLSKEFSILGKVSLLSPAGGERWLVGTAHEILWQSVGAVPAVNLEFSNDGFKKNRWTLQQRASNSGRLVWTVPDFIGDKIQIRISDARVPEETQFTSPAFSVVGDFVISNPLTPVTWKVGQDVRVEWQNIGTLPQVRLEYEMPGVEGGKPEIRILQDQVPNQGTYNFKVPDWISDQGHLKISDVRDPHVSQQTVAIRIEGGLESFGPAKGAVWQVGQSQLLQWKTVGSIPFVTLEYSSDNFQKDVHEIQGSVRNDNRFVWQVPDAVGVLKLRVRDARDEKVYAISEEIQIRAGLQFLRPNPGIAFTVGTEQTFSWKATGTVPQIRVEYSRDSFSQEVVALEPKLETSRLLGEDGNFSAQWKIPDAISSRVQLRLTDVRNASVSTISEPFQIQGAFEMTEPENVRSGESGAAGKFWTVGSRHELSWKTTGSIPQVRLQFSRDGFRRDIQSVAPDLENKGNYAWTVPDQIGENIQVRVLDPRMPEIVSALSRPFSIAGELAVTAPSVPVTWQVGEEARVAWQTTGSIPLLRLEYILPNPAAKTTVAVSNYLAQLASAGNPLAKSSQFQNNLRILQDQVPNQGSYSFRVPDWIGEKGQIKISDVRDARVSAVSPFVRIEGSFRWRAPFQGSVWRVGEEQLLEWQTQGSIPSVVLEYSSDNFQRDIHFVQPLLRNENKFLWTVPDAIGALKLRVRDAADDKVFAISEEVQIRGALQILSPKLADKFVVGKSAALLWKAVGSIPQVKIEASQDGFQEKIQIVEPKLETSRLQTQEGAYIYFWTVPDLISSKTQIRVTDLRDESVRAVSEPFKIQGALELSKPQGGEIWKIGSLNEIAWKTTGSMPQVRLEYSRDGFQKDAQLIVSGLENKGTYSWTMPDLVNQQIWIRVSDEQDASVFATHPHSVEVDGILELVQPAGGETWKVGEQAVLEWKSSGSIRAVRLEYVPVSGEQRFEPILIADQVPNQRIYSWQIPNAIASLIQIRVSDSAKQRVASQSSVPVKVTGILRIISPDTFARWPISSTQEILWETKGSIPQVKVEYSRDGFQKEIGVLYPLLSNAGSLKWKVTDLISKNFQIRISDLQNPNVSSTTPALEITGGFQFSTPAPLANLEVGASQEILWQTLGTLPEVRLEYSADHFRHSQFIAEKIPNSGRYVWQVPDTLGDHFEIKISSTEFPETQAISPVFSIQGKLQLRTPVGGEIWNVGDDVEWTWDTLGSIKKVTLEYSTDEFATPIPIQENLTNQGHFTWRVPDVVSDKVKVRVRDAQNPTVFSSVVQPIKIKSSIRLLAPQTGEFWEIGTPHAFIWQNVGSMPFVSLEYSTDNFASAVPIILGVANENRYQWTVPDLSFGTLRFRVSDAHDQSVFALSEPIEIGGRLTLLSPSGGENLKVGEDAVIAWKNSGSIPNLRIEISPDDFTNQIQEIAASTPNKTSFAWKVPDQIGNGYKIRISDVQNPKIQDISKASFKISGELNLKNLSQDEPWQVGSMQKIQWTSRGTIPVVRLEYSKDHFAKSIPIATSIQNTGRYEWQVPDLAGEKIQFRVSDAKDPANGYTSLYEVDIIPVLQMTSPKGGEIWKPKEAQPITWQTTGTLHHVTLEYSLNDYQQVETIAASVKNTGSFLWTVPDMSTRNLKIRVVDTFNPKNFSGLRLPVQILGNLQLTHPMGGEVWFVGAEHPIVWESSGNISNVRIEYSVDGFRTSFPIAIHTPNEGRYDWTVSDSISKEARVRVINDAEPSVYAENSRPFEIRGALNLLTPSGGEIWAIGSRHPISWQTTGTIPQVRLEYSVDDFASDIHAIAPVLDNKGVFYWEVPAVMAPGIKVRIVDLKNPEVYDVSKSAARIQGTLDLLSPSGAEIYQVGERVEVQWRGTPNIGNVKLEYSFDDFETSTLITDFVPNTGKYVWNLPNIISDQWRLRVSDAANATVFAFSKVPFRTRGGLELLTPKGGEIWTAGSRQTISWNTLGTLSKIHLEYSSDDFKTSIPIATNVDNTGTYNWTVPEIPNPDIRIRVIAAQAPSVLSTSKTAVHITGDLKLLSPGPAERWVVGEERIIRWRSTGYIPLVDLEYSKDNFNKDIHSIAAKVPNVDSYTWRVPHDLSREVKIRVRNSSNNQITALSENPFQIDLYHIRWAVKDLETNDHLNNLTLTDSTGKTESRLDSPAAMDYAYGIYTTVWSRPGYAPSTSTWLADRDQNFEVLLEPQKENTEMVRGSFDYNRDKDLMKITVWYEKDAKPVATVIEADVKIYYNNELIKSLTALTPDNLGYFKMVWDTSALEGNSKYFASVAVTTAAGRILTSPISFQIELPVKEKKEPVIRQPIVSTQLKPITPSPAPMPNLPKLELPQTKSIPSPLPSSKVEEMSGRASQEALGEKPVEDPDTKLISLLSSTSGKKETKLLIPAHAVLHETVSINYISESGVRPVLDLYNSNRKLILKAQSMKETDTPGTYTYLLALNGVDFIPGKPVHVSIIELKTGHFKSGDMMIDSSPTALGFDKQVGRTDTILDVLRKLDAIIRELRKANTARLSLGDILKQAENQLTDLSGLLNEASLNSHVISKLNEIAMELGDIAASKGYPAAFVTSSPLPSHAGIFEVSAKVQDIRTLVQNLEGLY